MWASSSVWFMEEGKGHLKFIKRQARYKYNLLATLKLSSNSVSAQTRGKGVRQKADRRGHGEVGS